jgi:hypothetical protein
MKVMSKEALGLWGSTNNITGEEDEAEHKKQEDRRHHQHEEPRGREVVVSKEKTAKATGPTDASTADKEEALHLRYVRPTKKLP